MIVRAYDAPDLQWMLPMAKRYFEDVDLLQASLRGLWGWVVPERAALVFHPDRCGTVCSGLTDTSGIRDLMRLSKHVDHAMRQIPAFTAHSHMEPGTWQDRVYRTMGFQRTDGVLWWRA